jgi:hypothetical protein
MLLIGDSQATNSHPMRPKHGNYAANQTFYRRGRWYNQAGQLLGHGDLSCDDVQRIKDNMGQDDLFIVISAMDEWYRPSENIPVEQLVEKSPLIISKAGLFFITKSVENFEPETTRAGIKIKFSTPDAALRTLVYHG